MSQPRYRFRVTSLDTVVKGTASWNSPIPLGYFEDQSTDYFLGIPVTSWGLPYNAQSYVPQVSACKVEQTWDELHPRAKGKRTTKFTDVGDAPWYDSGGPFLNVKIETGLPTEGVVGSGMYYNLSGTQRYIGGFMTPPNEFWGSGWAETPLAFTGYSNALLPDVAAYFDRAWRQAKPKLEFANLYVFLREIGDTVPMLQTTAKNFAFRYKDTTKLIKVDTDFGSKYITKGALLRPKMGPKTVAENFINHEFGWRPFLGDIQDFARVYVDASELIKKITDENGKWVRKSVGVTKADDSRVISEVTLPYSSLSYALPCFPVGFPASFFVTPPSYKIVEREILSIHAAGKFRFYRPDFDVTLPDYSSAWHNVTRAMKIFGAEINPYHIWQAIPWTWLVDWVSNLGSFIQRMSDTIEDQVAASYFFITAHKRIERTMTINLPFASGLKTLVFTRSYSAKQRVSADSPYGFRVFWNDLSPERLAILASLGIVRRS